MIDVMLLLREQWRRACYKEKTDQAQQYPRSNRNSSRICSRKSLFCVVRAIGDLRALRRSLRDHQHRYFETRMITHDNAAVWRAAAAVLDLPPGVGEYGADMEGPDKACSTLGRQMMLPLRHGGLGLHMHMQSDEVSDAAFVSGAGQAERNLKGRPAALCPLQGAGGASVRERWRSLYARYAEQCKWDAAAKSLPTEFLDSKNGLLGAKHLYGRTCPTSTHLWLRQTPPSPRLRRQPQRTQASESHTRPSPLATQRGIRQGHRAGGRAGSVAGAVSCRWRCRSEHAHLWMCNKPADVAMNE